MEDNSTHQENSQSQNSNSHRDFKGIWIPREIWLNQQLLPLEKCLWGEIHSLHSRKKKGCFASREYLADFFGVSERYIKKMLSHLREMDLVEDVSFNGRQKVIRAKIPPETYGDEFTADVNYSSPLPCPTVHPSREPQFTPPPTRVHIDDNKEYNKEYKNIAQTPALQSSEQRPNEFFFSHQSKKFEGITDQDLVDWKECFPCINIKQEIVKATEWIKSNPTKSRKKLWRRFLTGWFSRANEKAENQAAYKEMRKNSSNIREGSKLNFEQANFLDVCYCLP